ncbi:MULTISPECIES: hypothetical protein [Convivina]|uniref:Uncharacterized protein n=2 Tax=Convivina TaxID=1697027 RepID=A0A2U1D736_9LACO|nr:MULTISPECIES: hypothetical protein [Convivina]SDC23376.1 hypothetical protein SAMN05216341_1266 [Leuconostocaceae bacterium R-53105]PVY83478.1 hypothetical protein C7384_10786 [Convivina intestini]CAH1853894.1 hypothetical protein R078131_00859 [Convivina intestini]CAH1856013.1 hypothetical protein R078138_01240 [Convivina sp. LMG 32447]CAH1856214.1 hypothetical protein R077815_01352 [Convivina sp. LMG 32447]
MNKNEFPVSREAYELQIIMLEKSKKFITDNDIDENSKQGQTLMKLTYELVNVSFDFVKDNFPK